MDAVSKLDKTPLGACNYVSPEKAFELACSYRYDTLKDGSVNDQKLAPSNDSHVLDCIRYSVASKHPRKLIKELAFETAKKPALDVSIATDKQMMDWYKRTA